MKIICESCGAKYSIADEKVAGKVFKIRCKKCSEVIVVRGDQPEEADEETRIFDYGSDASWHVVVDGEQQGPLTPEQIGDLLSDGRIDWEAFVWREGFDNWQPARDVEALVAAISGESSSAGAAPAAEAETAPAAVAVAAAPAADPYGSGEVFGGTDDMGKDPFAAGSDDGGLSGLVEPAAASASAAGGSADLFAGVSGNDDFAGGERSSADSGASSPRVSEEDAMTGSRNENSVLFSLSNLQALATSSGSAPPSSADRPGMAQGEGSGLIDIRALASANQAMTKEGSSSSSDDSVESLLAVGGGGSTFSAAAIAAPVAAEKAEGNNKMVLGAIVGIGVVLAGLLVALLLKDSPSQVAAAPEQGAAPAAAAATAAAVPSAAAAEAAKPASPEPAADEEPEEEEEEAEEAPSAKSADDDEHPRQTSKRSSRAKSSHKEEPAAASKKPDPEPAPKRRSKSSDSIDDLLSSAIGGGGSKPKRAQRDTSSSDLPKAPDRNSVKDALQSVAGAVQSCGNGKSGVAMTKITVSGKTGRVTNAVVSGDFAGTPVGSCVAKKVRAARFPKFQQSTFSVSYPYRI